MKISIYNQKEIFSGIYKIDFPNGKSYIGQSNNIIRRIREHNCSTKDYPITRAIKKYGRIIEFEILEKISPNNKDLMNEREIYYINYYDTKNREKGYNLSLGGGGYKREIPNKIVKLQEDIINTSYTFQELSNIYNINCATIVDINQGKSYFNEELNYPLRKKKRYKSEVLTAEEIAKIQLLLKEDYKKTMEQISIEYGVSIQTIQRINKGISPYNSKNYTYPIRSKNLNFSKFNMSEILEIMHLLKTTNMTQIDIAKKFNCDRQLIGQINSGKNIILMNQNIQLENNLCENNCMTLFYKSGDII